MQNLCQIQNSLQMQRLWTSSEASRLRLSETSTGWLTFVDYRATSVAKKTNKTVDYSDKDKFWKLMNLELFTESYGEPVNDLNDWDKADSKAEPTHTADAGDEVEPGHLGRSLKL